MTLLIIMVPLMIAAIAIATVPVLYHSVREHRLIHTGSATRLKPVAASEYSVRTVSKDHSDHREKVAA
jgi:hypothetical protein